MPGENEVGKISLGLNVDHKLFGKQLPQVVQSANKSVLNAFKPMGKLIGGALAIGSIVTFTKSCLDLGSHLQEVQNVVDVTFPSMSDKVNEFAANALEKFGLSETASKRMMGTYGAMSKSFGFTEAEAYKMAESITGLTADVASFYDKSTDEIYTKMKSIWTGETESLKELSVVMTQTALDQYALNNGFGKTTASMTEQEKVMLRFQFVQSRLAAASGDFARTQDSWANQIKTLTESWNKLKAALGQGFINLFSPILKAVNAFIVKLQGAANAFAKLTEMITGKKIDASMGSMTDSVDGVGGAAEEASDKINGMGKSAKDAAKKAMRSLAGFDQITKIGEKDSSGSGGSGGGASGGGAGAIAEAFNDASDAADELEKKLTGLVDRIKKAWKTGDFTELGTIFGSKVKEGLDSMPWDGIEETLGKTGSGIATFLNGVIQTPGLFGSVGKSIAGGIDSGINFAYNFVKDFEFPEFGDACGELVNGFFGDIEADKIGQTIHLGIQGGLDFAKNLLKKTDFELLGNKVGDFLGELDLTDYLDDIASVFWNAIKGAFGLLKGMFEEAPLETSLIAAFSLLKFTGLSGVFKDKFVTLIGDGLIKAGESEALSTAASSLGTKIGGAVAVAAAAYVGFNVGKEIGKALNSGDDSWYKDFHWFDKDGDEGFFSAIFDDASITFSAISDMLTDFKNNPAIATLANTVMIATGPIGTLVSVVLNLKKALEGVSFDFKIPKVSDIKNKLNKIKKEWDKIRKGISEKKAEFTAKLPKLEDIKASWKRLKEQVTKKEVDFKAILPAASNIKATWDNIKKQITDATAKFVSKLPTVSEIKTSWDNLKKQVTDAKANFKANLPTVNEIKTSWDNLKKQVTDAKANFKAKLPTVSEIKTSWDNLKKQVTDAKAKFVADLPVLSNVEKSWNDIKDKITGKTVKFITAFEDWDKEVKKKWGNIKDKITGKKVEFTTAFEDWNKDIKKKWENIKDKITGKKVKFELEFSAAAQDLKNWITNNVFSRINTVFSKVPILKNHKLAFAKGGFPEEGPFYMNKGEIAGKFSNGKGVVANNYQITKGIADAVGPSVYSAVKGAISSTAARIERCMPNIAVSTPMLELAGATSSMDKSISRILDLMELVVSGDMDAQVISTLKELLMYLKSADRDIYMDGEKVTQKIADIINNRTDATGDCMIRV